jgi:hypothetical protein
MVALSHELTYILIIRIFRNKEQCNTVSLRLPQNFPFKQEVRYDIKHDSKFSI